MNYLLFPLLFPSFQTGTTQEPLPVAISVDQQVKQDADHIAVAVKEYSESKGTKLKKYVSKDGRIRIYSDSRSKEAKQIFKLSEAMLEKLDDTLGEMPPAEGESGELLGLVINEPNTYFGLCDAVAEAAESQAKFMESSKDTTGFTIFAPELTVYFHDASFQEEGRIDHSIAHSLIHLELERRYGEIPLWIREGIATALEDMTVGEVWGPWYRNGFVFSVSHADWRGRQTMKQIERLSDFQRIFSYPARPYDDHFAHETFAFAVYCLTEEPEGLASMLAGMQEMYSETNPKGGRSLLTVEQTRTIFSESFEADFLERFQSWWEKPPKWNAKVKKSKKKSKKKS
jgi:hypothetical protein